jgi:DNA processing protein
LVVELFGKKFYYRGNLELLKKEKVAIVGSRRPNSYTKHKTFELANELAKRDIVVVSGAAMGVDAIAHKGAGANNTIAVMPCGLDYVYPKVNRALIEDISKKGLLLSPFEMDFKATKWSFVARNRWVVKLSKELIITEADIKSGSLTSAKYAIKEKKEIFVFPHRLGESLGTFELLKAGYAKAILDMQEYVNRFKIISSGEDDIVKFLKGSPYVDEALSRLGDIIYEMELEGIIEIKDARVIYRG